MQALGHGWAREWLEDLFKRDVITLGVPKAGAERVQVEQGFGPFLRPKVG